MCVSCGIKFLIIFFGGGIITIICLILFLFYQHHKIFADYDLLHGNFNLYNLLHRKKIEMRIFRKIINYKLVKIETVGEWILFVFVFSLVKTFNNFLSGFIEALFQ